MSAVAKWLALPTSDHEVLGSNKAGYGITEPFIITLPLRDDLNDVERDVNHKTIIVWVFTVC